MPLRHLIALIINAHPLGSGAWPVLRNPRKVAATQVDDIDGNDQIIFTNPARQSAWVMRPVGVRIQAGFSFFTMSQEQAQGLPEANLVQKGFSIDELPLEGSSSSDRYAHRPGTRMVEPDGIEPTTSCLQSRRSPS